MSVALIRSGRRFFPGDLPRPRRADRRSGQLAAFEFGHAQADSCTPTLTAVQKTHLAIISDQAHNSAKQNLFRTLDQCGKKRFQVMPTEVAKMTQLAEFTTPVLARGRHTKFTPERIQQIRNLVERGKSREEIAELIGVTVGSLQVTCSRLGVSLRRPIFNTGTGLLQRGARVANAIAAHNSGDGTNSVILQLTKERPEQNSQPGPLEQAQIPTMHQERAKRANEAGSAKFAIRMQYKGEERTTELPLTQDMIRQLAFEAELRNMRIGELIGELMVALLKKDLFQAVLQQEKPDNGVQTL
jgi:hypothetical protein